MITGTYYINNPRKYDEPDEHKIVQFAENFIKNYENTLKNQLFGKSPIWKRLYSVYTKVTCTYHFRRGDVDGNVS